MDFIEKYSDFLQNNREIIRRSLILHEEDPAYIYFKDRVRKLFHELPEQKKPELRISATDGSEFSRELYNGQKLVVARAVSQIEGEELEEDSFHLIHVDREQKSELIKRIMENLEHIVATRSMLEKDAKICIMDGSLSGRLYWRTKKFDTDLPDIYSLYTEKLVDFLRTVKEKKVILIFIGKSSETMILKRTIMESDTNVPENVRRQPITDHLLIKSIVQNPGYTEPIFVEREITKDQKISFYTMHVLPSMDDTPMKVDFIIPDGSDLDHRDIVSWIMWGYTGLKNHNLWISLADKRVKFHREETEDIIMKLFIKMAGSEYVETRGERRARIRF
ncbi:MAG: DNA double-strand break repair nuclease NurA [Candidatus Thermoplasmatota archaeon]|nr:DNA double-strand break repair nuclease NurA [Candidatus Thermoplasmatota archaeon]